MMINHTLCFANPPFRGFKLRSIRTCTITTACSSQWSYIVHVAPCLLQTPFRHAPVELGEIMYNKLRKKE